MSHAAHAARLAANSAVRDTAALCLLRWWRPPRAARSGQLIAKEGLESEQNRGARLTEETVTWYRRPSGIRPPEVAAEHNSYHDPIFFEPPRQCSNVRGCRSPRATEEYWGRRDTYLKLRYTLGAIPEHSAIGDAGGITFTNGEEETDKAADEAWNKAGTAAGEAAEAAARAGQAAERVTRSEAKFTWFLNVIRSRRQRQRAADNKAGQAARQDPGLQSVYPQMREETWGTLVGAVTAARDLQTSRQTKGRRMYLSSCRRYVEERAQIFGPSYSSLRERVAATRRQGRKRGSFTDVRGRGGNSLDPTAKAGKAAGVAAEVALRAAAQTKSQVRRTMGAPEEARCRNRANQLAGAPRSSGAEAAFTAAINSRCAELIARKAVVPQGVRLP